MAQTCPQCSTSNADTATLCKQCGTPLPGAVAANAGNNGVPKTTTTPSSTVRKPSAGAIAEAARRAAAQQKAAQAPAEGESRPAAADGASRRRAAGDAPATPTRRPLAAPGSGAVTRSLNRALDEAGLPRFSTRRYLVIWAGALVVILGTLALLVYMGAAGNIQAQPTPVPGAPTTGNVATVETPKGSFKIALTTDASMEETVRNFKEKVASGFYDGLIFHRVEDWVVQGGDPRGDGTGGGSMIAEYNDQPFDRGSVGVASQGARAARNNDAQFFVVKQEAASLRNNYANFGQVDEEGMKIVDQIQPGDTITRITLGDE